MLKTVNINQYKELLRLGLPIMIAQLGMIVLSFADTVMIGHCGTPELGAAGFVNNMFNLVIVFSTGFSYGLTPVVGSMFGREDPDGIGRILKNSLLVNGTAALVLTAIMSILYLNLHRLGQPEELLPLVRPYYLTILASLIFILLFNSFRQFAEGITDTVTPMCILLGGNLLNIVLNWAFIYGKMGMPELGLLGAGIATLISRIMMFLVFVLMFLLSKRYTVYRNAFMRESLNKEDFLCLNRLGLPVGLQMGMETASFSLSTIMVGWIGTVALAAHQVMLTIGQLGFMLYYGMAAAVAVLASNYKGKENYVEVRRVAGAGFRIILVMASFVSVAVLLLRGKLGYMFSENSEVVSMVSYLVIPFVIYQFGDGMQCNYSNALRGVSDVRMVSIYAFIAYFVVSLPAAYLFGFVFDWGLTGIWFSFPLGLTTAGVLFYCRFRSGVNKMILR